MVLFNIYSAGSHQVGSGTLINLDQAWSNLVWLGHTVSDWIRPDQAGSETLIRLDQS